MRLEGEPITGRFLVLVQAEKYAKTVIPAAEVIYHKCIQSAY